MWFWVHLRLGPSQMGSDHNLAPKHPQTPPNANICFIRYACMLYDVVGCVWCPPWTAHGLEIPTCAFGTEPEICPDEGHLALKVVQLLIGGRKLDLRPDLSSSRRDDSRGVEHFF